ncbi:hypothetical protein ACVWWO_003188 [Bradyrhizobium sp. F1.13.1]
MMLMLALCLGWIRSPVWYRASLRVGLSVIVCLQRIRPENGFGEKPARGCCGSVAARYSDQLKITPQPTRRQSLYPFLIGEMLGVV